MHDIRAANCFICCVLLFLLSDVVFVGWYIKIYILCDWHKAPQHLDLLAVAQRAKPLVSLSSRHLRKGTSYMY